MMKHKVFTFLLLMISVVGVLSFSAGATDAVDEFAEEMRAFQEEITVPARDFDALMKETFTRYPELYFYYSGCNYRSTADGLELTMRYQNTDKSADDLYIVDSREKLVAAVGLILCDLEMEADIILTDGFTMTVDEFLAVCDEVERDYYLIYMGTYWRGIREGREKPEYGVAHYKLEFSFYYEDATPALIQQWRDASEKKVLELAGSLFALDMPDYQKAYLIHEWLVDNNFYDVSNYDEVQWENHIAFGTLCEGNGVCQSYAEAARMLCDAAGIPCYCVPGYGTNSSGEKESHRWNCIQLGGEWYFLDTTWDDPVTYDGSSVKIYRYFNVTSQQMREDHVWEEGDFPTCTATTLNYDRVMELMAADTNTYSDYSNRNVRTQAIMRAELEAILYGAPVEEPVEEPVDEGEEPADEQEEPADEQEEPADEPEEPADGQEEPADEQEEPADEPEEPDLEPVVPEELEPVVKLDEQKQQEYIQLNWIALLIALALFVAVTAIALNCVANGRVMSARDERQKERRQRLQHTTRTTRKF